MHDIMDVRAGAVGADDVRGRSLASYRTLTAALVVVHLAVSLFMVFGGLLVWRGLAPAWVHLPLAAWGVFVHVANVTCPLTPLEKCLRRRAGLPAYERGFVEQYLMPRSMRGKVTRHGHVLIGLGLLAVNAAVYGAMLAAP